MSTAWRSTPPKVEEVRGGMTWWWRRADNEDESKPRVVHACLDGKGDEVIDYDDAGWQPEPLSQWYPGEWAPCFPPKPIPEHIAEAASEVLRLAAECQRPYTSERWAAYLREQMVPLAVTLAEWVRK